MSMSRPIFCEAIESMNYDERCAKLITLAFLFSARQPTGIALYAVTCPSFRLSVVTQVDHSKAVEVLKFSAMFYSFKRQYLETGTTYT